MLVPVNTFEEEHHAQHQEQQKQEQRQEHEQQTEANRNRDSQPQQQHQQTSSASSHHAGDGAAAAAAAATDVVLPDADDPLSKCADVTNTIDLEGEERRLRRRMFKQRQYEQKCMSGACFEHMQVVWLHKSLLHDLALVGKAVSAADNKKKKNLVPVGCTTADFPILDSTPAVLARTSSLDPREEHVAHLMNLQCDLLKCYAEELRLARNKVGELMEGFDSGATKKGKQGCCARGGIVGGEGDSACVVQ